MSDDTYRPGDQVRHRDILFPAGTVMARDWTHIPEYGEAELYFVRWMPGLEGLHFVHELEPVTGT